MFGALETDLIVQNEEEEKKTTYNSKDIKKAKKTEKIQYYFHIVYASMICATASQFSFVSNRIESYKYTQR